MTCSHLSIKRSVTGQIADCTNCRLPIIYDGKRWRWLYDLDATKRRKLVNAYYVDLYTEAQP